MHELCALMSLMLANEYHHATITRISDCKWESVASQMKGMEVWRDSAPPKK